MNFKIKNIMDDSITAPVGNAAHDHIPLAFNKQIVTQENSDTDLFIFNSPSDVDKLTSYIAATYKNISGVSFKNEKSNLYFIKLIGKYITADKGPYYNEIMQYDTSAFDIRKMYDSYLSIKNNIKSVKEFIDKTEACLYFVLDQKAYDYFITNQKILSLDYDDNFISRKRTAAACKIDKGQYYITDFLESWGLKQNIYKFNFLDTVIRLNYIIAINDLFAPAFYTTSMDKTKNDPAYANSNPAIVYPMPYNYFSTCSNIVDESKLLASEVDLLKKAFDSSINYNITYQDKTYNYLLFFSENPEIKKIIYLNSLSISVHNNMYQLKEKTDNLINYSHCFVLYGKVLHLSDIFYNEHIFVEVKNDLDNYFDNQCNTISKSDYKNNKIYNLLISKLPEITASNSKLLTQINNMTAYLKSSANTEIMIMHVNTTASKFSVCDIICNDCTEIRRDYAVGDALSNIININKNKYPSQNALIYYAAQINFKDFTCYLCDQSYREYMTCINFEVMAKNKNNLIIDIGEDGQLLFKCGRHKKSLYIHNDLECLSNILDKIKDNNIITEEKYSELKCKMLLLNNVK